MLSGSVSNKEITRWEVYDFNCTKSSLLAFILKKKHFGSSTSFGDIILLDYSD